MVYDESHHILALSEYHGYPSALSKGEPSTPIKHYLRGGQGLLEAVPALRGHLTPSPQQAEKVFSHVLGNSLSGSSSNSEETDNLPPLDVNKIWNCFAKLAGIRNKR